MSADGCSSPESKPREQSKFHWRGMTSLTVTAAFLVLATTGVILYFTPQGRVAHWTGWTVLGLGKEQWSGIHITASIVFVVSSLFHVYFNWCLLVNYIVMKRKLHLKRELAAALLIVLVVAAGTVVQVPPFSTIISINDRIKLYWENQNIQAPYPHAEDSTVQDFCERTGMSPERLMERFQSVGIVVNDPAVETLREIAEAAGFSPLELFSRISKEQPAPGGGSGLGRLSVKALCEQEGIPLEKALEALRREGFDVQDDSTFKSLAGQKGVTPMEVKQVLEQSED